MSINGLLTQDIFERNPTNDFYVEESFPLDWMFPYLAPYGVIMHINRQPVSEVTDEMVQRDHAFWSAYSSRLSGDWITYDTTVKDVADFVDRVYIQHDFTGFKGNYAFMRDEQAQKSFSKLRTAIAGVYSWRLGWLNGTPTPPAFVAQGAARDRMLKEADFAYKQAFAFCPFSPEVVFRYVQFLANQGRMDDARYVASTCLKFDPNNDGIRNMVHQLGGQGLSELQQLEQKVRDNPTDFSNAMLLANYYVQLHQVDKADGLLDALLKSPNHDPRAVGMIADMYYGLHDYPRLELAMQKLADLQPGTPEPLFDLAKIQVINKENPQAISNLGHAIALNDVQRAANASPHNLRQEASTDAIFGSLSSFPEYRKLVAPKQ
jgi:tetratricopeptide (TPR) repeat protein